MCSPSESMSMARNVNGCVGINPAKACHLCLYAFASFMHQGWCYFISLRVVVVKRALTSGMAAPHKIVGLHFGHAQSEQLSQSISTRHFCHSSEWCGRSAGPCEGVKFYSPQTSTIGNAKNRNYKFIVHRCMPTQLLFPN